MMFSYAKRHSVAASLVGWHGWRWSPPCRGPPQYHSSCGWGSVMLVWTLSWMPSWSCWACGWHLHSCHIHMRWPGWCMQSAAGHELNITVIMKVWTLWYWYQLFNRHICSSSRCAGSMLHTLLVIRLFGWFQRWRGYLASISLGSVKVTITYM